MDDEKKQYQLIPVKYEPCQEDDELDLRELIKTILKYRKFVIVFTSIITLLAIVYVLLKTPLYEVKANMEVGFIGNHLLVKPGSLVKTLQSVYHVGESNFQYEDLRVSGAYVEDIDLNERKVRNFIQIKTIGLNNQKAIAKVKDIVTYVQNEYQSKLNQYILNTKNQIENLKIEKNNILEIIIPNLKTQIKLIKDIQIPEIDKKIELLKTQKLIMLEGQIDILKNQNIKELKNKIDFYRKYKLKEIDDKIIFYRKRLKEYNKAVESIYREFSKENDTKVMIASIQMVNYQNLILNLQNEIKNLELNRVTIINETIPKLLNRIEKIKMVNIRNIQFKINNIVNVQIPNLKKEKEKIRLVNIKNIQDKIVSQNNKISEINARIKVLQYNLSPANIQNSKIVGGFIIKDHPSKPKRKLVITLAFITGLILSIFLIFLIEFWKKNKEYFMVNTEK